MGTNVFALVLSFCETGWKVFSREVRTEMTKGDFTRWMYRGQRPNRLARAMNRMSATIASFGITSNLMVTLETTGRTTGRTISQPMVIAVVDRQRYLVSMLGENVNWVKNVRAAGGKAALRSGTREEILLE